MLIIIFILLNFYLFLIGSLAYGFDKVPSLKMEDITPKTKFSVIIPFRNEAEQLPKLLKSISKLNYPEAMFEIIFIDDGSKDNSVDIINKNSKQLKLINISVIKNERTSNAPKKDALTTAIKTAKHDWIVTTDADCKLPKYWLDTFDNYIQKSDARMLAAPVTFGEVHSFFERFQLLDMLSLQGATIGGFGINMPFLCNGANLAYQKGFFNELNGFDGNSDIASGDDIFLLEKAVKQDKNNVIYIKNEQAIVTTNPQPNFKSLISQRVRWAAKTSHYKNVFGKLTGFLVLLMNALLICLPLLYVWQMISVKTMLYTVVIKFSIDFLLLFKTARFFGQERYLASYLFSSVLYPFFSVYVAFISVFKGYKWKGRTYTK